MKVGAVSGDLIVKVGIGLGLVAIAYVLIKRKGGAVSEAIGSAFNPASPDNVVNRVVSSVGKDISGNDNWTLGGWLYEAFNGDAWQQSQADREAELLRESRRGQNFERDLLTPVTDQFDNPIYPYP